MLCFKLEDINYLNNSMKYIRMSKEFPADWISRGKGKVLISLIMCGVTHVAQVTWIRGRRGGVSPGVPGLFTTFRSQQHGAALRLSQ